MYKTRTDHGGVLCMFVLTYVKGKGGGKYALFGSLGNYFHIYLPLSHVSQKTLEISIDGEFYIFTISRHHSILKCLKIVFGNSEISIPVN